MNVISEKFFNQNQSWNFERIIKADSHKLKVTIRRNAYDNQSYANVERWSGTRWEFVYNEPIELCLCKSESYVNENPFKNKFVKDAERLIEISMKIIN